MNIKIVVATHKTYSMPEDPVYFPLQVGAALNSPLEYPGDNTGDNISAKNKNFCELTAVYWAWKNLDADYIGLAHYRRHFRGKRSKIIGGAELEKLLSRYPVIMPCKRNYFIETNYSQYVHAHHVEDLETVEKVLTEKYPQYMSDYHRVMKSTKGYRFNMCIMRKDLFDDYCSWLFDILFEVEKRLDISGYSPYDARVFGFLSERLLDIYIEHNKPELTTLPVLHLESQRWCSKIFNFLRRKFFPGKA